MTREIKFRAWNTQENKMLFRKLFDMNWYTTEKNDENGSHCWGAISGGQSRFLEVMQYTGLKDKNGKEIYEGDIVRILYTDWGSKEYGTPEQKAMSLEEYKKSISEIGCVVWSRDRWEFKFGKNRFGEFSWGSLQEGNHGEKEIIGNIYENPDLLKK